MQNHYAITCFITFSFAFTMWTMAMTTKEWWLWNQLLKIEIYLTNTWDSLQVLSWPPVHLSNWITSAAFQTFQCQLSSWNLSLTDVNHPLDFLLISNNAEIFNVRILEFKIRTPASQTSQCVTAGHDGATLTESSWRIHEMDSTLELGQKHAFTWQSKFGLKKWIRNKTSHVAH